MPCKAEPIKKKKRIPQPPALIVITTVPLPRGLNYTVERLLILITHPSIRIGPSLTGGRESFVDV